MAIWSWSVSTLGGLSIFGLFRLLQTRIQNSLSNFFTKKYFRYTLGILCHLQKLLKTVEWIFIHSLVNRSVCYVPELLRSSFALCVSCENRYSTTTDRRTALWALSRLKNENLSHLFASFSLTLFNSNSPWKWIFQAFIAFVRLFDSHLRDSK